MKKPSNIIGLCFLDKNNFLNFILMLNITMTNAKIATLLQIDHVIVSATPKLDNMTGRIAQTAVVKLR